MDHRKKRRIEAATQLTDAEGWQPVKIAPVSAMQDCPRRRWVNMAAMAKDEGKIVWVRERSEYFEGHTAVYEIHPDSFKVLPSGRRHPGASYEFLCEHQIQAD